MIICKDGGYSYIGETMEEAYNAYIDDCISGRSHQEIFSPDALEWYYANEDMVLTVLKEKPGLKSSVGQGA
jgi:hypothetical protein